LRLRLRRKRETTTRNDKQQTIGLIRESDITIVANQRIFSEPEMGLRII
jgi:hypothetical protein